MKKILVLFLASIFVFAALCGCGEAEYQSGSFYTMEEAYENGWITKEDIMEACYRRFGSVYECSAENPEKSVKVDYTSPYPDPVLDEQTKKAIIHAYYIKYNGQKYGDSESEDYTLTFYGEFHDSYVFLVKVAGNSFPSDIVRKSLAGIEWSYTEEPDFIVFRFDESKEVSEKFPSGKFYTMEEAYENGWITKEDIMEACYRRFGSVYECSAENPEKSVKVDYTSPYPDPVLDEQTKKAIIHAYYIETKGPEHGISESEDYTLTFYGKLQGSYILVIRCVNVDYGDGTTKVTLAGITWVESGPAFKVFRFDEKNLRR